MLPGRHARRTPLALLRPSIPTVMPYGPCRPASRDRWMAWTDAELAAGDWLVPAPAPLDNLASLHGMAAISARLRAPDGCPWDRRQTHASLRPFVLEEAYEMVDAIERGSPPTWPRSWRPLPAGDPACPAGGRGGRLRPDRCVPDPGAKIVRRHPHVFGDVEVADAAEVLRNWETIKADERRDAGAEQSPFAGIARALPALPASREIQERASSDGLGLAGDRWGLGEGRRGAG